MKKILICIAKIILVIIVLFTKLFYLPRSVILHLGAWTSLWKLTDIPTKTKNII